MEKNREKYRCINSITNVMLTLNSSINFLIYCLVGKKFRRIFVRMVCHKASSLSTLSVGDDRKQRQRKRFASGCCRRSTTTEPRTVVSPKPSASATQYIELKPPRAHSITVASVTSIRSITEQPISEYNDQISARTSQ